MCTHTYTRARARVYDINVNSTQCTLSKLSYFAKLKFVLYKQLSVANLHLSK